MKSSRNNRAEKMLKTDRIGLVSGSEQLIREDVERVLLEYFCLIKPPIIKLNGIDDEVVIEITAHASSVKRFNILK